MMTGMRHPQPARWRLVWWGLAIALGCTVSAHAQATGTTLDGRSVPLVSSSETRAVVLFFIASDCPISNRTLPEMKRVATRFATDGVQFWFVYPNATETPAAIRTHKDVYALGDAILADPHQQLSHIAGAKVTPETAVLVPDHGALHRAYVGRADDQFLAIGKERPHATRHDLEDAIAAVLDGKPSPAPGGPPVGCGIVSSK